MPIVLRVTKESKRFYLPEDMFKGAGYNLMESRKDLPLTLYIRIRYVKDMIKEVQELSKKKSVREKFSLFI